MEHVALSPIQKALAINLDAEIYGSIAEIGAGQEVARTFFQAGGASGTIGRSISAYDMAVSDSIYGKTSDGRYVSKNRVIQMLDYEYDNLMGILSQKKSCFFVYANTISALNYKKDNYCHGWMGLRYQLKEHSEPNEIILHIRLWENDNHLQQRSAGIVGINLIYAAYFYRNEPLKFLKSLMDDTGPDRVSIDMLSVSGPDLNKFDNRLVALQLVKNKMSEVAMFDRHGLVSEPADMLYKKNVMIIRGSFRPITYVGFDMLKTGYHQLKKDVDFKKDNTITLCEMTMDNLLSEGNFQEGDFLERADLLCGMGQNVLISNFREYYRLVAYMSQFKTLALRLLIGSNTFRKVIEPVYYNHLKGGVLEAFGRLFANNTKIYLYPSLIPETEHLMTSVNLPVEKHVEHLLKYLTDNNLIIDLKNVKKEWLSIYPHHVRKCISNNDSRWKQMVPAYVSKFIEERGVLNWLKDE